MIVCVLDFPHDGEQPRVAFVDMDKLPTTHAFHPAIQEALKDPRKVSELPPGFDRDKTVADRYLKPWETPLAPYLVAPPCHVNDCVTVYWPE